MLVIFGAGMVDVGFRGTGDQLGSLLAADIPGFVPWAGAMLAIGMLGYVPVLRTPSHLLMALVLLVLFLSNRGIFANLAAVVAHPPAPLGETALVSPTDIAALEHGPTINVTGAAGSPGGAAGSTAGSGPAGAISSGFSTAGQALGPLGFLASIF